MTTAEDILTAAYRRADANQDPDLASLPELLGHLQRTYQRLYALHARARPDLTTTTMSITLLGDPAKQIMAPVPIDLLFIFNADAHEVNLIPATERERTWHLAPCVYRNGAYIISRAHGGDPIACDVLELTVLDAPVDITALTTLIDPRFPVRHQQLLVDTIALYLDAKDTDRAPASSAKLAKEYLQALGAFASEYEIPPEAIQWAHAPVKHQKGGAPA